MITIDPPVLDDSSSARTVIVEAPTRTAAGLVGAPSPQILTLRAFEVEVGDVIVGFPRRPVARIVYRNGCWSYADGSGLICRRHTHVQVIRGADGDLECPTDWAPPHGIPRPGTRHLGLIRGGLS